MVGAVSMRRWLPETLILLLAAGLRLYGLDLKPPHFDEGVNGYFVDLIKTTGMFDYDPTNYHGPLHMYVLFVFQTVLGREAWVFRLPVALAGIASVAFLLWGWRRLIPRPACLLAGALLAISPAAIFVARYAIHETWLVLALVLFAAGAAEWWWFRSRRGVWWFWLGLALAALTKETWIIHVGCFAVAIGVVALLRIPLPSDPKPELPGPALPKATRRDHWLAPGTALATLVVFYSAFGMHAEGLLDFFRAYLAWFETGTGETGHEKVEWYWLQLMLDLEWAGLLGLALSAWYLVKGTDIMRWLSAGAFGAFLVYSLIPYKTPWCLISFLWPYAILLGDAAVRLARYVPAWIPAFLVLIAAGHDLWRGWLLNYIRYDDPREPYVYVQTKRGYEAYIDPLLEAARENPQLYNARGIISVDSVHPIPWVLGDFYNVGYHGSELPSLDPPPDFLMVNVERSAGIDLGPGYWRVRGPLRDGMNDVVAWFREELFPRPDPEP